MARSARIAAEVSLHARRSEVACALQTVPASGGEREPVTGEVGLATRGTFVEGPS